DPGRPVVLELVVVVTAACGPVGKLQVGLDRVALDLELPASLDGADPLPAVAVVVELDRLVLLGDDRRRLLLAPEGEQRLGLAHAAIVADPADPLAERLAFLDRPGFFLIHVKAQLTGSLAGRGCGSGL